ncbi:MAG TPA: DUF6492 family protein [Xanthobacteraceae bacterium]|nr:DUF6492 family protein [Xanthobacteraceae bacterium]
MNLGLVTPTYERDLERCELLCESVDRHVTSFSRHYLIVLDEELPLFTKLNTARREVLPLSLLLPSWLKPLPRYMRRKHRRYWWSLRALPVSGWHVQQFVKINAVNLLSEARFCLLDSDVVFFRPFDMSQFAEPNALPLLQRPRAIASDAPLHAPWIRSTHGLLGLNEPAFPADDFIGHIIAWDQHAVRAMIERIEHVTGCDWVEALARRRDISEYLLYGHFVASTPRFACEHRPTAKELCLSYWDSAALDESKIERMLRGAASRYVAFSAASFSDTPVERLRAVLSRLADLERQVA